MTAWTKMGKEVTLFTAAVDLVSFLFFLCILPSVSAQFSGERMALAELKKSFSDPHGILDSWNINAGSSNHCSWYGVSCNPSLRVSMLKIGGNLSRSPSCSIKSEPAQHVFGIARNCSEQSEMISGTLSAVIGNFTYLRILSLPFNEIGGEIPAGIWGLRNLEVLDLEGNDIYGNFSSFGFSCLRKLRVLNLASNRIVGKFPPSLSECRSLRILNLAGNRISDVIPRFVGGLGKLRVVNLSFNRLTGYIPSYFRYDCGNLVHLDLSCNFLKGEIPRALGNCSRLRTILLSSNALDGVIPNELGKIHNLEVLNVARNRLGGPLPANLGNCTGLSVLVLSCDFNALCVKRPPRGRAPHESSDAALDDYNSFEGSIPEEIMKLQKLKILWAPGANFEGRIPRNWGSCKSMMMVNLAQNHFTGDIVGLFTDCTDLQYLNLSSNRLSGKLDENLTSSCITMYDVSGNMLSGPIPGFNPSICHLHPYDPSVSYTTFLVRMSNEMEILDNDRPSELLRLTSSSLLIPMTPASIPDPPTRTDDHHSSGHGLSPLGVRCVVSAFSVASVILAVVFLFWYYHTKIGKEMTMTGNPVSPQSREVIVFNDISGTITYDSIVQATENFHIRYCIGNGGFGRTYRAEVAPGNSVAVKRLTAERQQGAAQFNAEVTSLRQISHPHLITLLGYYSCGPEMFLIYNYLPGGDLDQFIRDREGRVFDYSVIHKIALHIASALWYMHDQCNQCIIHRDIKPSNILLDDDGNAFLSDFGLCKRLASNETYAVTCVAGTYGYIAPEYALTGSVSNKADVYSYGVVLLEMLSDKRALDPSFSSHENGFNIVSWACLLLAQSQSVEVFRASLWEAGPHDKLVKLLHVAVMCTVDSVASRPTMRQVVHRLHEIQPASEE